MNKIDFFYPFLSISPTYNKRMELCYDNPKKSASAIEEIEEKQKLKKEYKQFLLNRRQYIMTSRFGTYRKSNGEIYDTWEENMAYRKKKNIACIYCSPHKISEAIPIDSILFILEMNNDLNKIMGIGMIKNHPICGKYSLYKDGNFNRYVYTGKYRIDRDDMTEKEEEIMKALDILCFTGNTHLKRGKGITAYPPYMLFKCHHIIDLVSFISDTFKSHFSKNETNGIKK